MEGGYNQIRNPTKDGRGDPLRPFLKNSILKVPEIDQEEGPVGNLERKTYTE